MADELLPGNLEGSYQYECSYEDYTLHTEFFFLWWRSHTKQIVCGRVRFGNNVHAIRIPPETIALSVLWLSEFYLGMVGVWPVMLTGMGMASP